MAQKYFDPKYTHMALDEEKKKEPRPDIEGFTVVFEDI
jgi:hypothetical protein